MDSTISAGNEMGNDIGHNTPGSSTVEDSNSSDPPSSSSQHLNSLATIDPQTTLALQTNSVTNAVDDLMSGYDRLNDHLPGIAAKVATMQSETEYMATKLEEKMRFLVDGFEHLDSVSSQIPESIRALADSNKNNILESTNMVAVSKMDNNMKSIDELERLKNNLTHFKEGDAAQYYSGLAAVIFT